MARSGPGQGGPGGLWLNSPSSSMPRPGPRAKLFTPVTSVSAPASPGQPSPPSPEGNRQRSRPVRATGGQSSLEEAQAGVSLLPFPVAWRLHHCGFLPWGGPLLHNAGHNCPCVRLPAPAAVTHSETHTQGPTRSCVLGIIPLSPPSCFQGSSCPSFLLLMPKCSQFRGTDPGLPEGSR